MENEINKVLTKVLTDSGVEYELKSDTELIDYNNEQLYTIKCDISEEDYEMALNNFATFAKKIEKAFEEDEAFQADYVVKLEARFATNNHYIFIIGAYK